jgi:branched-chain amino acid transport system ATP-binding protein
MQLTVTDLRRHYGGVRALDGVSFEVAAGECVALIGPNGAGKSTCFGCLAGQQRADGGAVSWAGEPVLGLSPQELNSRGIARTFQVAQVFEALTVHQNLQLAMQAGHGLSAFLALEGQQADAARALLERLGLAHLATADAASLPYGAKKRLELGIAIAREPKLLLLDEPAAGLAPGERHALMDLIKALAASGVAVLYTEHNMDAVFGVADRVLVLIDGQLAAEGTPQEVAANETVRRRYLGMGFSHA